MTMDDKASLPTGNYRKQSYNETKTENLEKIK